MASHHELLTAVQAGTGRAAQIGRPAAGKTGTTQENADGWFIAMHPHLVVGSWTGFNDRRIKFRTTALGQGARTALPNVGAFFQKLQAAESLGLDVETVEVQTTINRLGDVYRGWNDSPGGARCWVSALSDLFCLCG